MEWKTITDYPNYQISNCGLIKNKKEKFLKSRDNNHGYEIINLCNEGKRRTFSIHRLVGLHFLERNEKYNVIDHIDRDRKNNHFSNLRFVDHSCNNRNKTVFNKTGFVGVYKRRDKYIARIRLDGTKIYLGSFDTPEEAGDAYQIVYNNIMKEYDTN
jgi:hypothetical protein